MLDITINNVHCQTIDDVKRVASSEMFVFLEEWFNTKDYIIAYTSGSTGNPKEIRLSKKDMLVSAKNTNSFFKLNKKSLYYLNLSPLYIAGKMMILRALDAGAAILEEPASNNPLSDYYGNVIDLCAFVPSQLISLFNNPERLQYISNMIIGGGVIPMPTVKKIIDYKINAFATYGMTETCSHIALSKISLDNNPYSIIGLDNSVSTDERGCLVINLPKYSVRKIITNDVVEILDSKNFYWKGRHDNVINSGGIKIFPEEIEPIIKTVLPTINFFISSVPSDIWGEELVLAFEYPSLSPGEKKQGEISAAMVQKLKKILPKYAVPHKFIAVNKFNYTPTGKLIRKI